MGVCGMDFGFCWVIDQDVIVFGIICDLNVVDLECDGCEYCLIDIVGLCRCLRVDEVVEKFLVVKIMQLIEQCQVVVLMFDVIEGVIDQDVIVFGVVFDVGRALVIAINKWDGLIEYQCEQVEIMLLLKLGFVLWVELVCILVKYGLGLCELFPSHDISSTVTVRSAVRHHPTG